jgi:hypothetical protein
MLKSSLTIISNFIAYQKNVGCDFYEATKILDLHFNLKKGKNYNQFLKTKSMTSWISECNFFFRLDYLHQKYIILLVSSMDISHKDMNTSRSISGFPWNCTVKILGVTTKNHFKLVKNYMLVLFSFVIKSSKILLL